VLVDTGRSVPVVAGHVRSTPVVQGSFVRRQLVVALAASVVVACGSVRLFLIKGSHAADLKLGDVVIFPMLTFHGILFNTVPGQLRLNADVRYQPASHPMDPRYSALCLIDAHTQVEIVEQHAPGTSRAERAVKGVTVAEIKARWGLPPWTRPALWYLECRLYQVLGRLKTH
jgi:hypothetical protein